MSTSNLNPNTPDHDEQPHVALASAEMSRRRHFSILMQRKSNPKKKAVFTPDCGTYTCSEHGPGLIQGWKDHFTSILKQNQAEKASRKSFTGRDIEVYMDIPAISLVTLTAGDFWEALLERNQKRQGG